MTDLSVIRARYWLSADMWRDLLAAVPLDLVALSGAPPAVVVHAVVVYTVVVCTAVVYNVVVHTVVVHCVVVYNVVVHNVVVYHVVVSVYYIHYA